MKMKNCNNCLAQYCVNGYIPTIMSKYPKYADAKHAPKTKKKKHNKINGATT